MHGAQTPDRKNGVVDSTVTAWKKKKACSPLSRRCLFLYACIISFSCQGPLGVSAYLSFPFFLIKFKFFYLFIHSLHIHTHKHIYTHTRTHTHTHTHIYIYIYKHTYIYIHTHTYIYVYIYIYIYTYIYIYIIILNNKLRITTCIEKDATLKMELGLKTYM